MKITAKDIAFEVQLIDFSKALPLEKCTCFECLSYEDFLKITKSNDQETK